VRLRGRIGLAALLGHVERLILCQIVRDMPVVSTSISLMVSSTSRMRGRSCSRVSLTLPASSRSYRRSALVAHASTWRSA
jgi:hypothetical protein